ncbi:hypothetical protein QL285_039687 [Trifolium repens]|jgi:hypothetical protein|nr:hypothetical protein QL285_039687 [Trifolium repens]
MKTSIHEECHTSVEGKPHKREHSPVCIRVLLNVSNCSQTNRLATKFTEAPVVLLQSNTISGSWNTAQLKPTETRCEMLEFSPYQFIHAKFQHHAETETK